MNKSWILHTLKINNLTRDVSIHALRQSFVESIEYASSKLNKQGMDIWEFLESQNLAQALQNEWNDRKIKKEIRKFDNGGLIYFIHRNKNITLVVEE